MTPLAVRCILRTMEQTEWTEAQLIQFAQDHGYTDMTGRKLKRFRQEGVLCTPRVDHPGFGGTTSVYPAEAGPHILAVCRLLKQRNNYNEARVGLWLEGYPIEIGLLKQSIWSLTPFSTWKEPTSTRERRSMAQKLKHQLFNAGWKSVRTNFVRKVLQNFENRDDQQWFLNLETNLLYGIPVDFSRDFLRENEPNEQLEEPTDIFAHGLQTKYIRLLPKDITQGLQQLSDKQVLSWTKLKAILFAATTEELELARERQEILSQMLECLEIMGYTGTLHRLVRTLMKRPTLQAFLFCAALTLEQSGYGPNLEEISRVVHRNLPILQRMQEVRTILQQELPAIAKEIRPLPLLGKLFIEGTQQQRDAYMTHLQTVYQHNKEAFDAFWQRHPELFHEILSTAPGEGESLQRSPPPSS